MKYDIAVLGGGPGGYVSAIRGAKMGAEVVLIEEDRVGGTCLNRGCIPTKVMLESAHRYDVSVNSEEFGISAEGVDFNYSRMLEKRDSVVEKLVSGVEKLLDSMEITMVKGYGELVSPGEISVEGYGEINARNIILAMGSESASLPHLNIDGETVLDSDQVLLLNELPGKVIIVGAGAIGCEFAYFYSSLGVEVELVEIMKTILPAEEKRLTSILKRRLNRQGVNFHLNTSVDDVEQSENGVSVKLKNDTVIEGDFVFLSVGRRARLDAVSSIEELETDQGRIVVDFGMRTSIDGVYAIGDLVYSPMLAHVASEEGEVAVHNILGQNKAIDYDSIPSVVYTSPELARVGPTEDELKEKGKKYDTVTMNLYSNGRALGMGAEDGVVKLISDGDGFLIGGSILSPSASEMIGEIALAVEQRVTLKDLTDLVHNHPSISEAIGEAYKEFTVGAIHRI